MMKLNRSTYIQGAAVAALAIAALGAAGSAQARSNVYWSVGVQAAPGVAVGVGNTPVYYDYAPVYYAPAPVYVAPQPVYYVRPAPVYYGTTVYYGGGGYRHNHKWHGHGRHWRRD